MGAKTKIDWCDSSWNPVTGCEHGCPYCYAKGIAERFGTNWLPDENPDSYKRILRILDGTETHAILELDGMQARRQEDGKIAPAAFPLGFTPTFHRYRLDEPKRWEKPKTIFVCSMADLFGKWVPDRWIMDVFEACGTASRHRYLFLTKNPKRYIELAKKHMLPAWKNMWYGYSATREDQLWRFHHADECPCINLFVSIEPILEPMQPGFSTHTPADWVIIGAETGHRKGKVIPEKKWIDNILMECEYSGRPIFMKESLRNLMGKDFKQEFPWGSSKERRGNANDNV